MKNFQNQKTMSKKQALPPPIQALQVQHTANAMKLSPAVNFIRKNKKTPVELREMQLQAKEDCQICMKHEEMGKHAEEKTNEKEKLSLL
jgi:hypothetical protein